MIVVCTVAWCLLLKCPTVCWIAFFPFCDARYKRYRSGKDLLEKNQSLFLWSVRRSPGTLCWKQESYFSELAFIYVYFDLHVLPIKSISDLSGFFTTKAMIFENLFPKIQAYYFDTLFGGIGWKNSFQTIDGKNMVYSKLLFKIPGWMWHAEMSIWKWRKDEWWCLWKMHIVS